MGLLEEDDDMVVLGLTVELGLGASVGDGDGDRGWVP